MCMPMVSMMVPIYEEVAVLIYRSKDYRILSVAVLLPLLITYSVLF